ncbi:MAG: hypothetical protein R3C45_02045 [Phycisphaerales bacterium]
MAAGNQLVGRRSSSRSPARSPPARWSKWSASRTITPGLIGPGSLVFSDVFDPLSIHIYKILQALAGDLNGDGFVGIADLNIVLARGTERAPGDPLADPSGDGFVGIADLEHRIGQLERRHAADARRRGA